MLCPCLRYLYDTEKNELTAEERAARDAAIAAARRAADLAAKNPVTYAWKKFEAKVRGGGGGVVVVIFILIIFYYYNYYYYYHYYHYR